MSNVIKGYMVRTRSLPERVPTKTPGQKTMGRKIVETFMSQDGEIVEISEANLGKLGYGNITYAMRAIGMVISKLMKKDLLPHPIYYYRTTSDTLCITSLDPEDAPVVWRL